MPSRTRTDAHKMTRTQPRLIIPFESHLRSRPKGIIITETNMRRKVDAVAGVFVMKKRTKARKNGSQTINIQPSIPTKIPTESTAKPTRFAEYFIVHHLFQIGRA